MFAVDRKDLYAAPARKLHNERPAAYERLFIRKGYTFGVSYRLEERKKAGISADSKDDHVYACSGGNSAQAFSTDKNICPGRDKLFYLRCQKTVPYRNCLGTETAGLSRQKLYIGICRKSDNLEIILHPR